MRGSAGLWPSLCPLGLDLLAVGLCVHGCGGGTVAEVSPWGCPWRAEQGHLRVGWPGKVREGSTISQGSGRQGSAAGQGGHPSGVDSIATPSRGRVSSSREGAWAAGGQQTGVFTAQLCVANQGFLGLSSPCSGAPAGPGTHVWSGQPGPVWPLSELPPGSFRKLQRLPRGDTLLPRVCVSHSPWPRPPTLLLCLGTGSALSSSATH